MDRAFGEPTTDSEAQQLKRFLEQGAQVELETIQQFSSEAITLRVPETGVLLFPQTEGLLGQISGDTEALLTLDVTGISLVPNFALGLFLNTPDAGPSTSFDDPGYISSVSFFCHTEERNGTLFCVEHGEGPARFRVPMTTALKRKEVQASASVSIVPTGSPGEKLAAQSLEIAASIDMVRSIVKGSA